uniref:Transposase n=1 Tax=Ascaris lumbricoides TaxID=6252 RepID=A0A0M3I7Y5_ASCLU
MDRGDILSQYKYVVLTERTVERIRDIETVVGKARVQKALGRWLTKRNKTRRMEQRRKKVKKKRRSEPLKAIGKLGVIPPHRTTGRPTP